MAEYLQKSSNLTRMAGHTDELRLLGQFSINLIEDLFAADLLIDVGLPMKSNPKRIVLDEALLECICRELLVDVRLAAPVIACVATDTFSEELLDLRDKGILLRQVKALERELRSCETATQRADVVFLRKRDLLLADFLGPECVHNLRLLHALRRQMSISPGDRCVTVQLAVITIPSRGSVI